MFISGRIEILGKHTDYCGGQSIVCAIDRGFHASVAPRDDRILRLTDRVSHETVSVDLADPQMVEGRNWSKYPVEVARRLTENFGEMKGAEIEFFSDLPMESGMSSSSGLMILVFSALAAVNDLTGHSEFKANINSDRELAEYLGCIENGQSFRGLAGSSGVGTFGGSQDHAAILLSKAGHLSRFSFSPLREQGTYLFPEDHCFVIASSGVTAAKTGDARDRYNRAALLARSAAKAAGMDEPLAGVIDRIGMTALKECISRSELEFPAVEVLDRVQQFYIENYETIPKAVTLLAAGRIEEIGDLIDRSQLDAEIFLRNQVAETVYLQRSARNIGALCSSAFGAGFGGSVYSIVKTSEAVHFAEEWQNVYLQRFPERAAKAKFFITRPDRSKLPFSVRDFQAFP